MKEIAVICVSVSLLIYAVVNVVPAAVETTETSIIHAREQKDLEEVASRVERMRKQNERTRTVID